KTMSYSNQRQAVGNQPLSLHNLKLHILGHGDRYDLKRNLPLH
ncbi:MAG: cyanophycinase, partial [Cyanobacteriota bacterium]